MIVDGVKHGQLNKNNEKGSQTVFMKEKKSETNFQKHDNNSNKNINETRFVMMQREREREKVIPKTKCENNIKNREERKR